MDWRNQFIIMIVHDLLDDLRCVVIHDMRRIRIPEHSVMFLSFHLIRSFCLYCTIIASREMHKSIAQCWEWSFVIIPEVCTLQAESMTQDEL